MTLVHAPGALSQLPLPPSGGRHRLLRIQMSCAAPLEDMADFYGRVLGLAARRGPSGNLVVQAGLTELVFYGAAPNGTAPFYHFAFNIPENKIQSAHDWQLQRTPLLPISPGLRDPSLPDHVVHYRHWNAHSIFFFDPCGNVVEYIARHDLRNPAAGAFTPADILYASEIAFVADDVAAATQAIAAAAGAAPYGEPSPMFAALGDEHGLLLVMKRGRVISFESPRRRAVDVFPTDVVVHGSRPVAATPLAGYPYQLTLEERRATGR
jgi:catechol 2,3-dioxygenase-like lactoylglutathione lyase family enzyme